MNIFNRNKKMALAIGLAVLAVFCRPLLAVQQEVPKIGNSFVFTHPGLLNDLPELNFIKQQILSGKEPWKSSFEKMKASRLASLGYTPKPFAKVSSGFNGSGDHGGFQETTDASAAYTQALMWIFTGDEAHARKSAEILDSWSSTLQGHEGGNWYLQTAWTGAVLPQAGEILRATYPKWGGSQRLGKMLNNVFLPVLHNRMAFGNRELAVCNALVAIGIFNNDPAAVYEGIDHYMSYLPAYFYVAADGPTPKKPDYWLTTPSNGELSNMDSGKLPSDWTPWMNASVKNQGDDTTLLTRWTVEQQWTNRATKLSPGVYLEGYSAETGGRDLSHAETAFIAAIDIAEMAWHQGIDLYAPYADRLTAFIETTAKLRLGVPASKAAYGGTIDPGNGINPTFEIAYHHFHDVMKMELPETKKLIDTVIRNMKAEAVNRPFQPPFPRDVFASRIWGQAFYTANWETLTHAELNANH